MKTGIATHYADIDFTDAAHPLPTTPIDERHAIMCARRLYRWALGEYLPDECCAITSGQRYTWMRRGVLMVNASAGWKRVAHDLSHLFWMRANPGERPHSKAHARFEAKLVAEIIKRKYHLLQARALEFIEAGKIVDEPGAAKESARAERIERLRRRELKWEAKAQRAATALAKIRRSLREYERIDAKRAAS